MTTGVYDLERRTEELAISEYDAALWQLDALKAGASFYLRVYDSYANNYKLKKLKIHEAPPAKNGEVTVILEEE